MIIDIKKTTIGIKLRKRVFILLILITATVFLIFDLYQESYLGINGVECIVLLSSIWILYLIWGIVRDYTYFYYMDQGLKLVFRYYSIASFIRNPNSIEIKKNEFLKFEVEKRLFGLRKYLIIYQKTPKGVAKYPPISISLLKKSEQKVLSDSLIKVKAEITK